MPIQKLSFNCTYSTDPDKNSPIFDALKDLPHLAKLASDACGWPITEKIEVRVVDGSQAKNLLIQDTEKSVRAFFNDKEWEKVKPLVPAICDTPGVESGLYLGNLKVLLIVLNKDLEKFLNKDNYKRAIFHELIHAAQFQNKPEFFKTLSQYMSSYLELQSKGEKREDILRPLRGNAQKMLTIAEGQAKFLELTSEKYFSERIPARPEILTEAAAQESPQKVAMVRNQILKYLQGTAVFQVHSAKAPEVDKVFNHDYATQGMENDKAVDDMLSALIDKNNFHFLLSDH